MTAAPAQPRRRYLRWVLAALLLVPILEVLVLVLVGRSIGVLWTVALLVGMALLGAWLSRRETGRTYRALQQSLRSGRLPADEATDAILVMVGGFLLILPGFLTDLVGLLLVLPFTRPAARRVLHGLVTARVLGMTGAQLRAAGRDAPGPGGSARGQVIEGEVVTHTPPPGTQDGPAPPGLDR